MTVSYFVLFGASMRKDGRLIDLDHTFKLIFYCSVPSSHVADRDFRRILMRSLFSCDDRRRYSRERSAQRLPKVRTNMEFENYAVGRLHVQPGREKLDPERAAVAERRMRAPRQGRCLLYTSPSPRDQRGSRMPSSA